MSSHLLRMMMNLKIEIYVNLLSQRQWKQQVNVHTDMNKNQYMMSVGFLI